jgi:hypothetical protein
VVKHKAPTKQTSTVERGKNASARMSAVVRRFRARRKVLSFIGLRGLSFDDVKSDIFGICLGFKGLHNRKRFGVGEWF